MRPAKRENEKTRKPENQKTGFWPFSRFRVSRCSHLRASLIASLIDCNMLLDANTAFLLSPLSGLRVFAVFGFSPFSGFRRFRRFRVFAVFAVFGFSRFCVFVLRYITYTCPNLSFDNVFIVLRNGLLRYILYTCPKV